MRLSVIIPAHNEEVKISVSLKEIDAYLQKQGYSYELLVVDDGSTDKTREITESLQGKIKRLKVAGYKENRGKGCAVRTGMFQAKGDYCLFTDADNSISIEQIEKFWPELERGADVVIASRDIKGSILDPPQPWWRRTVLGRGFRWMRKIILNLRAIEDTQCGFKCFKKEAAAKIFSRCRIDGFAFDIETLLFAHKMGFVIKEIPVRWRNRPESKVNLKATIRMALDLLKIKSNFARQKII